MLPDVEIMDTVVTTVPFSPLVALQTCLTPFSATVRWGFCTVDEVDSS